MKRILTIVLLFSILYGWAQAPEKINFQTVLHQTEGTIFPNQSVKLIVNIISESADGDIVYREEHSAVSNEFGLINLQIGNGNILYGQWSDINWGQKNQFVMIELDTSGTGNNYVDMGIAQTLSVPYALFANESELTNIWQENELGIHYSAGNVSIGQETAIQDLEIATDSKISLSSDMSEISGNNLLSIQMDADTAEPNISFRNDMGGYMASFSTEDFTTNPITVSKSFIIGTADATNSRRSRIELKYDENIADFFINDANLIIDQDFSTGNVSNPSLNRFWAHNWVMNNHVFGIGNKNWESEGVYGTAAAELYTNGQPNFLLLNSAEELDRSQLVLRRGNAEWVCGLEDIFYIKRNDAKKMKFLPNGNVKIGSNDPIHKLDVYGDVNIPVGYSYLIGGSATNNAYAEYFESEETIEQGALVGINLETGLVRNYQEGDVFIGIICEPTGFIANNQYANNENYVLVGLEGLLSINSQKSEINNHQVFTNDGKMIGTLIGEKVYLK